MPNMEVDNFARLIHEGTKKQQNHASQSGLSYYLASGDSTQIINNGTIEVQRLENNYHGSQADDDRSRVVKWLVETNDNIRQQATIFNKAWHSRSAGSGSWLLKNDLYLQWLAGDIRTLWLHGGVGCGKTVLSAFIAQSIQASVSGQSTAPRILQYFCSFRYSAGQELSFLLRMILAQLCSQHVPETILKLYNECRQSNPWQSYGTDTSPPSLEQLKAAVPSALIELSEGQRNALRSPGLDVPEPLLTHSGRVYIVIDALDELVMAHQHQALTFLRELEALDFVHILATSRTHPNIQKALQINAGWPEVFVGKAAIQEDITAYVDTVIASSELAELDADLQREIKLKLNSKGSGMFLWVALQLRHLQDLMVHDADIIRDELRILPGDLYDTYTRVLDRIKPSRLRSKAIRALRWLALSRRPLRMHELIEACSVVEDLRKVPALVEPGGLSGVNINTLLADLVYLDPPYSDTTPQDCTVTLAHASVQDFLVGNDAMTLDGNMKEPLLAMLHNGDARNADLYLAEVCLAFVFSYNKLGVRKEDHPLLSYAWYHWDEHLDPGESATAEQGTSYFRNQAARIMERLKVDYSQHLHWLSSGLLDQLLNALDIPYFYPEFQQFRRFDTSEEGLRGVRLESESPTTPSQYMDNVYGYEGLSNVQQEARFLEILPGLSQESLTECRLRTFPIESAPTFDAISYMWGTYNDPTSIFVNGERVFVQKHLSKILKNLRRRSEVEDGHLWVDAISINQKNVVEMNQQVALLGKLFGSARRVLISFGEAMDGDAYGVKNMITIANSVSHGNEEESKSLIKGLLDPENHSVQLFERAYWTRVWIIQEVVLAKDLTILFGDFALSLQHLEACFSLLNPGDISAMPELQHLYNVLLILQTRREFRDQGGCDLFEIMLRFKHYQCRNPCDKIYGLLGLTADQHRPNIRVDYSESMDKTFTQVSMAIIEYDQNLRCLSYHPVRNYHLHSWSMSPSYEGSSAVSLAAGSTGFEPIFGACGQRTQLEWRESSIQSFQSMTLNLGGLLLGRITRRFDGGFPDLSQNEWSEMMQDIDTAQIDFDAPPRHTGKSTTEVRWRTMLADQWPLGKRLEGEMLDGVHFPPRTREEEARTDFHRFAWIPCLMGRALYVAEFLGSYEVLLLGPRTAQVDDTIAVLYGGSVPFILRPYKDTFVLMGECYVHGFMDGEALEVGREQYFTII